jgi:hypothetical protein
MRVVLTPFKILAPLLGVALVGTAVLRAQMPSPAEQAVGYSKATATDPVARLQQRINAGELTLAYDETRGYLPAVLQALNVPVSYLVYSEAFDALPSDVKSYPSRRLGEILAGEDASADFARLSSADRWVIREILEATKPALLRG